ncbi:MAG: hypothetical protein HZB67_05575, partial [Candidatus Aenigmarchaeota archaeon]|nr:hypothetical protein [Candidatus Aenigmarchaeota archaeon]
MKMRSISGAMGGYRESLSDVMSEIGMKFCKLSEPYSNTYDKKLLHIILYGAEHHKSFKDLYYVVDYRTGKREFNRAKQKGMLDILYRAQTGEYADHIKHYFGDSPYSNS